MTRDQRNFGPAANYLSFQYDARSPFVVRELCFQFENGAIVAVIGANGSGKTTLGKLMCGLLVPSKGEIFVNGMDITTCPSQMRMRLTCYVPQVGRLSFITSSLADEVQFWLPRHRGKSSSVVDIRALLEAYCIPKRPTDAPLDLTTNEAWRFLLLLVELVNPLVVFIDETPSTVCDANITAWNRLTSWRQTHGSVTCLAAHRILPRNFGIDLCLEL